jgi:hypothetical protein
MANDFIMVARCEVEYDILEQEVTVRPADDTSTPPQPDRYGKLELLIPLTSRNQISTVNNILEQEVTVLEWISESKLEQPPYRSMNVGVATVYTSKADTEYELYVLVDEDALEFFGDYNIQLPDHPVTAEGITILIENAKNIYYNTIKPNEATLAARGLDVCFGAACKRGLPTDMINILMEKYTIEDLVRIGEQSWNRAVRLGFE